MACIRRLLRKSADAIKLTEKHRINDVTATFGRGRKLGAISKWVDIERETVSDLMDELEPTDVFYDIGSNVGVYTCFASKIVTTGYVVAFDPFPPNVEQLRRNVDHNDTGPRVTIEEVALSDSDGEAVFHVNETGRPGYGSGSLLETEGMETQTIAVDSVKGDDYVSRRGLPQPSVVKIDVEGAEYLVIEGLAETLSAPECRLVYCEVHPRGHSGDKPSVEDSGADPEDVLATLRSLGFTVEESRKRGGQFHVKARKE